MATREAEESGSTRDGRATGSGIPAGGSGPSEGMVGMARVPFGEALRYYRKQAGLTQTALAELAGMGTTQAAVALAEKSNTPLRNKERMNALARALNISPSALAIGLIPSGGLAEVIASPPPAVSTETYSPQGGQFPPMQQMPYIAVDAGLVASQYGQDAGQDILGERLEELEKRLRDVERFLTAVQQSIGTLEHLANSAQDVVSGTMSEIAQIRSEAFQLSGGSGPQIHGRTGSVGRGRTTSRSGR